MPLVCYLAHASAIAAYLQLRREMLDLPKPFQRCNHPFSPLLAKRLVFYWSKTRGLLSTEVGRAYPYVAAQLASC